MLLTSYSVKWSIASSMSSKLEPVMWLRDTGHIGIHKGADGRTDGRTYVRTRVLKQATVDNFPVGVRWISGLMDQWRYFKLRN